MTTAAPGYIVKQRLNLHYLLERSTENGPGTRAVIWVQGCTLRCPGCFNPDTHDLGVRTLVAVDDLARRLTAIAGIEGITISGGEPFLQAAPLAALGELVQQAGLGIVVFTGFTYAHLVQADAPAWNALLTVTDLLIAGPFRQALASPRLTLRGSANQTLHYLSDRYAALQVQYEQSPGGVEILIDPTGDITLTGFPHRLDLSPSSSPD
ncbi:4Fe-4S cluster-binding domain-containing protein [candidate division KSB3 bacterium]|uniref:4Fe-4S cluster-binding domain-containing protein n=1 Tax=candidate division KSB3 bacterium TaxID=2044937 RepID=A0A9D5JUP1_9BACT|nr:4Fe-4S cluster-binding domain-containing protein [candidate division KSB3 bacterium]MBD3324468.1 4Fe-4S cluster-binding domain-containing protein [candidate division KSB3 bacterium]